MLEQQHTEATPQNATRTTPDTPASARPSTLDAEPSVARYLAQLPPEERDAAQTRLEELTAAYRELEASPQLAAETAVRHLNTERQAVAAQQTQQRQQAYWRRKHTRRTAQSVGPATMTALNVFGAGVLAFIFIAFPMFLQVRAVPGMWNNLYTALVLFAFFGLPAVLGCVVGTRVRHRAGVGTFAAVSLLSPLIAVVAPVLYALTGHEASAALGAVLVISLVWLPIGTASAAITRYVRDKQQHDRLPGTAANTVHTNI